MLVFGSDGTRNLQFLDCARRKEKERAMGWVWKDDEAEDGTKMVNSNRRSDERCSTRRIVKSQCRTEEVEPGKFIKKCEKTEQLLKDCLGRPSEVVQSNTEYTEEDVTEQVKKGSFGMDSSELQPFDFPGIRSDIEALERNLFGGLGRFFEAAEDMKNGFFNVFGSPNLYDGESTTTSSSSSRRRDIPIQSNPPEDRNAEFGGGDVDISGLAEEV